MRHHTPLQFGSFDLQREYCPNCGDVAIFKKRVCVRDGCGYVLPPMGPPPLDKRDIARHARARALKLAAAQRGALKEKAKFAWNR